jgi:hypothetical protein
VKKTSPSPQFPAHRAPDFPAPLRPARRVSCLPLPPPLWPPCPPHPTFLPSSGRHVCDLEALTLCWWGALEESRRCGARVGLGGVGWVGEGAALEVHGAHVRRRGKATGRAVAGRSSCAISVFAISLDQAASAAPPHPCTSLTTVESGDQATSDPALLIACEFDRIILGKFVYKVEMKIST